MSADGGLLSGGTLSMVFFTAAFDILLFAWMHFTPDGLAFGASVANALGMTEGVAEAAGLASGATDIGQEVLVFS